MCMWVIFDQQQLLLSLKGGGQAAREEFWRVTEVGSSQEDGKDGDKLINENTRNKISINSLFDPQITYFLYLYIPPGSTESPTLRIGTSSWNSPASSPNENGWLEDNAHYIFCGGENNPFFHGRCYCSFLGSMILQPDLYQNASFWIDLMASQQQPCAMLRSLLPISTDPYWRPSTALLGSLSGKNLGLVVGFLWGEMDLYLSRKQGCTKDVLI